MESLFKFIMIRPAEASDPATNSVPLVASQQTVADVNQALRSRDGAAAELTILSEQILNSQTAIQSSDSDPLAQRAAKFAATISADTTVSDARAAANTAFGELPDKVALDPDYDRLSQRLSDTLTALKYLGRTDQRTDDLSATYRALAYVKLLALTNDDSAVPKPGEYFARTITIVGITRPPRPAPVPLDPAGADGQGGNDPRQPLRTRAAALQTTINTLTGISPRLLDVPTPAGLQLPSDRGTDSSVSGKALAASTATTRSVARRQNIPAVGGVSQMSPSTLVGPDAPLRIVASSAAIQGLPTLAQQTLQAEGVNLEQMPLADAVTQLMGSLRDVSSQLASMEQGLQTKTTALRLGSSLYEISPVGFGVNKFPMGAYSVVPTSHGDLSPVGIGDLLVVNQNLKRYDAYDLSDVVNMMKGEHRSTETKRTQSETTTTTLETTTSTEQERDQQSTERFEMQTETNNVQKSDESLKLGASVSASYGPFVTFKASADYGMNNSKEQSSKVATNYSKDVTSKASSKITQTVRRLQSTTYVQTFLEDNVHEWNNVAGTGHVVGMYQWLDKIYEARVYNYGKRLLFDTTVSEPAAFLYYSMVQQPPPGSDLIKPVEFTLSPDDLNEGNYGYYVQQYDAAGVQAPPAPFVTVTKPFEGADDRTDRGELTKSADLPVPDGYVAIAASVCVTYTYWDQGAARVAVGVGGSYHVWSHAGGGPGFWNTPMNNETGSVAFILLTFRIAVLAASVEVHCARTVRALETWKLATHEAIKQGYNKQLRDYHDALAAAKNEAAAQAHGSNPDANAQAIRDEMKRLMITLFTDQQFDSFGSVIPGPFGYPQMDIPVAEAQGAYARFFEEAFEWEQMMYLFYTYYWARKSLWSKRVLFTDNDPQFQAFLKAGAARVVVSVRPGFELAVAHFMETGQIWQGGNPPTITDPTYLSIVDEIKAQENAPQGQKAQGDPWDVRVPTTLVKLRFADTLPEWKKDASGDWISAN